LIRRIVAKKELFPPPRSNYLGPENCALVLHNNADAFGQNIESERATSLDGVIGYYSDAACVLHRKRQDLVENII
jgi:hypothetical protein